MKTEYSQEIIELIKNTFTPATPTTENAQNKTLAEIHEAVISVLPSKWVYEEDVYNVLQQLNFKIFPLAVEDPITKKQTTQFYYYITLNHS